MNCELTVQSALKNKCAIAQERPFFISCLFSLMPLLAQALIGKNNIFINAKIIESMTTLPRADINLKSYIVAYFVSHVSLSINE